jgi:hypothetical protein
VIASVLGGKGIPQLRRVVDMPPPDPDPGEHSPIAPNGGLASHQAAGGHTLTPRKAHVGATDQELLDRQARAHNPIEASTYTDRPTAERRIHENAVANRAAIEQWLRSNPTAPKDFELDHGEIIGRFSPVTASGLDDITDATTSRIVLLPDSSMPDGYRILTSYPRP